MEKNMSNQVDQAEVQEELDFLAVPVALPIGKLDADEYSAEDMDALTENAFGSGNVSFLSMQSAQCHDEAVNLHAMEVTQGDTVISNTNFNNGFVPTTGDNTFNLNPISLMNSQLNEDSFKTTDVETSGDVQAVIAEGNLSNGTLGSISASASSANSGSSVSAQFGAGTNMMSDETSMYIRNLVANQGGGNTTHVENITHQAGDTINNIIQGDFIQITNVINHTTNHLGDVINQTTTNLGDTINTIIQGDVTNVLNNIIQNSTSVVNNITNGLNQILSGDGKIALNLDADVLQTVKGHVGVIIEDSLKGDIQAGIVTTHLTDTLQDVLGIKAPLVTHLLNGVGANVGFNLLNGGAGTDNAAGDTDLNIHGLTGITNSLGLNFLGVDGLGQQLSHIALDPIESLVGDIDIDVNLPQNLLNLHDVNSSLVGTLEGLAGLNVTPLQNILDTLQAEGLTGGLNIELLSQVLEQPLGLHIGDITEPVVSLLEEPVSQISDAVIPTVNQLIGNLEGGLGDNTLLGHISGSLEQGVENIGSALQDIPCDLGNPCALSGDIQTVLGATVGMGSSVIGAIITSDEITPLQNIVQDAVISVHETAHTIGDDLSLGLQNIAAHISEIPCDLSNPCELTGDVGGIVHDTLGMTSMIIEDVVPAETLSSLEAVITDTVHEAITPLHDLAQNIGDDLSAGLQNMAAHVGDIPCDLSNPCELSGDVVGVVHDAVSMTSMIVEDVIPAENLAPLEVLVTDTIQNITGSVHDIASNVGEDLHVGVQDIAASVSDAPCDLTNPCELSTDISHIVEDSLSLANNVVSDVTDPLGGLLNDALHSLTENMGGSLGSIGDGLAGQWTETGLPQGGLFSDVISNASLGDMLPDPISGVAEGLGALDIHNTAHHSGGGLGGLFG